MVQLPVISDEMEYEGLERRPVEPFRQNRLGRRVKKRKEPDSSQSFRSAFQIGFLLLNLVIGIQFYLWVRYFETGGQSWQVSRPPGVEGWLPIASLMNLKAWILSGELPLIHPAGVFILLAFILISFLFRRAFCSWLCPVGTISEALWNFGRTVFKRNFQLPKLLDIPLRSVKYFLLALFLFAITSMSVEAIRQFLDSPYGIIADVKMLDFFRQVTATTALVLLVLGLLSVLVKNFWCRYLCPYGALLGLFSWLSPVAITRSEEACVDCGRCARTCPSRLPVDQVKRVTSPECLGCYQCVSDCQVEGALEMKLGRKSRVKPVWFATGILVVFLGIVLGARLTGHWHTELPEEIYQELVPAAKQFSHP